eukprot:2364702-Rhodomonas_salina.1
MQPYAAVPGTTEYASNVCSIRSPSPFVCNLGAACPASLPHTAYIGAAIRVLSSTDELRFAYHTLQTGSATRRLDSADGLCYAYHTL